MTNCTRAEKSKFIGQELLAVQFLERRCQISKVNMVAAAVDSGQDRRQHHDAPMTAAETELDQDR